MWQLRPLPPQIDICCPARGKTSVMYILHLCVEGIPAEPLHHRRLGVACSQVLSSTADGPACPHPLILSHWHLHRLWRVALGKSLMQVKGGRQTKTSFSYCGSIHLAYPSSHCPCRRTTGRSSAYNKERCAALLLHSW